jgi:hypothetical protein
MDNDLLDFPLDSVIWASSNHLEDEEHFSDLEEEYDIDASRIFVLGSVEQVQ